MADDLIIHNGTIIDGSGGEPFVGSVAVCDGRITQIRRGLLESAAKSTIDATGLYVTPGFIDIHSHSDFTLVVDPRAVSSVTQGVTLEVVGNCGHGCAPIGDPELTRSNIYGCRTDDDIHWRSMAEYLNVLERGEPAVNVATLVPNGNLRLAVAGLVDRPSSQDELRQSKKMLQQALEEGGFGLSTGLDYGPERDCPEEEIAELCRVTAKAGGVYATHTRNRMGGAEEAVAEALRTARRAEIPLQVSHISVVARLDDDGHRAVKRAIEQVEQAKKSGLDVGFDMHTRMFGTTNLSAALPPWALEGDKAEIAERLRSPDARKQMRSYDSIITALARGDWSKIVIFDCTGQPEWSRKSVAEIAHSRNLEPFDAICELLLADIDHLHELMVLGLAYREQDLYQGFEHTDCMIGSDATALAPEGPLAGSSFHGAYTWAAWFYRHFVTERQTLSPQEAVRRLTTLPATRMGFADRGSIRTGNWADLALFEPHQFSERGTVFEPNQPASGMRHVLVNGTFALRDGQLTSQRGGHVLRR